MRIHFHYLISFLSLLLVSPAMAGTLESMGKGLQPKNRVYHSEYGMGRVTEVVTAGYVMIDWDQKLAKPSVLKITTLAKSVQCQAGICKVMRVHHAEYGCGLVHEVFDGGIAYVVWDQDLQGVHMYPQMVFVSELSKAEKQLEGLSQTDLVDHPKFGAGVIQEIFEDGTVRVAWQDSASGEVFVKVSDLCSPQSQEKEVEQRFKSPKAGRKNLLVPGSVIHHRQYGYGTVIGRVDGVIHDLPSMGRVRMSVEEDLLHIAWDRAAVPEHYVHRSEVSPMASCIVFSIPSSHPKKIQTICSGSTVYHVKYGVGRVLRMFANKIVQVVWENAFSRDARAVDVRTLRIVRSNVPAFMQMFSKQAVGSLPEAAQDVSDSNSLAREGSTDSATSTLEPIDERTARLHELEAVLDSMGL